MKVFSVHERPIFVYKDVVRHPFPNVVTKYFDLADEILYGCSNFVELPKEKAAKLNELHDPNIQFLPLGRIQTIKSLFKSLFNNPVLTKGVEEADIIVARLPSFTGLKAIHIAKRLGKPYMAEVIGCAWDAYWNYGIKGKLLAPIIFYLTKRAVKNASHTVYVTDKFLQNRYPCKGKSIGASNVCISETPDEVLKNRLNKIESNDSKVITLATAAGIDNPVKGHRYVIEALRFLNTGAVKYHYYLLGGGSDTYLKSIAQKNGVTEYVHFVGQLSQENVIEFLRDKIDIYVQPSKQEGLPRALIEAMSQGCPAIGSKVAGIPELLDSNCIFKKGSVKEIVNLLRNFKKEDLQEQAKRNFEIAKNYHFNVISNRRREFFKTFKKDYKLI